LPASNAIDAILRLMPRPFFIFPTLPETEGARRRISSVWNGGVVS
jgi:hypothetical protein